MNKIAASLRSVYREIKEIIKNNIQIEKISTQRIKKFLKFRNELSWIKEYREMEFNEFNDDIIQELNFCLDSDKQNFHSRILKIDCIEDLEILSKRVLRTLNL